MTPAPAAVEPEPSDARAPVSVASAVGRMPPVDAHPALDAKNPWPRFDLPAAGPPRAIGAYSAGCVQGAVPLPLDGAGYQVMRPGSRRYYGHPELVKFVEALGRNAREKGLGAVLVGDLSHARGGRASGGHASHQTGLDVDVWFWRPEQDMTARLPRELRDTLEAPSVLDARGESILAPWKHHVGELLRLAAEDPRVDRIFVHASIKRELCAMAGPERAWLNKVRPWHGHDEHFHVRLACPASDRTCRPQKPLPRGDGCERLGWWFSEHAQRARQEAIVDYEENVRAAARWPAACDKLL